VFWPVRADTSGVTGQRDGTRCHGKVPPTPIGQLPAIRGAVFSRRNTGFPDGYRSQTRTGGVISATSTSHRLTAAHRPEPVRLEAGPPRPQRRRRGRAEMDDGPDGSILGRAGATAICGVSSVTPTAEPDPGRSNSCELGYHHPSPAGVRLGDELDWRGRHQTIVARAPVGTVPASQTASRPAGSEQTAERHRERRCAGLQSRRDSIAEVARARCVKRTDA